MIYSEDNPFLHLSFEGSPIKLGFKTQREFIDKISPFKVVDLSIKQVGIRECEALITDNVKSKSSKMKYAKSNNLEIITYEDLIAVFSEDLRKEKLEKIMNKIKNG